MAARRANPCAVKMHRTYTTGELAELLGVHKNTVRHWRAKGLSPIDRSRPALFHGQAVRAFLASQNKSRKRPCLPGTLYCFRCRSPQPPALAMADFVETRPGSGNLEALCGACGTIMHRRARHAALATVMPGIEVQVRQAPERLVGCPSSSLNCDPGRQGAKP
jgi:excisionase family DNA binding protein